MAKNPEIPGQMQMLMPESPSPSAIRACAPDPRTVQIAEDQMGAGSYEAAVRGGFEEPIVAQTPGVTPSVIRHAQDLKDKLVGRHNARNPSRPTNRQRASADVADRRRLEQLRREAAAVVEGDEGKVTLSEVIPAPEVLKEVPKTPPTPPSTYAESRSGLPPYPEGLLDEVMLRS